MQLLIPSSPVPLEQATSLSSISKKDGFLDHSR